MPIGTDAVTGKFAATDGNGTTGAIDDPYSITAAFTAGAVSPGETLWLRGGTYYWPTRASTETGFSVSLKGTSQAGITVRSYPGEWAVLDGGLRSPSAAQDRPEYLTVRDIEILVSENITESRVSPTTDHADLSPARPAGGVFIIEGYAVSIVNCIVRDNTVNGIYWGGRVAGGSKLYGNLIYDNGYVGSTRNHGHGIYSQNGEGHTDWKYIFNNMLLDPYYYHMQHYGSETAYYDYYDMRDNVCHATSNAIVGAKNEITMGGERGGNYWRISGHMHGACAFGVGYGGDPAVTDLVVTGCRIGATLNVYHVNNPYVNCSFSNNWERYSGVWAYNTSYTATGPLVPPRAEVYANATPSGPWVKLQVNEYDTSRAMLSIRVFDEAETVAVPIAGLLSVGDQWELRDARDYRGDPLQTGTCSDATITINMPDEFHCGVLTRI